MRRRPTRQEVCATHGGWRLVFSALRIDKRKRGKPVAGTKTWRACKLEPDHHHHPRGFLDLAAVLLTPGRWHGLWIESYPYCIRPSRAGFPTLITPHRG